MGSTRALWGSGNPAPGTSDSSRATGLESRVMRISSPSARAFSALESLEVFPEQRKGLGAGARIAEASPSSAMAGRTLPMASAMV